MDKAVIADNMYLSEFAKRCLLGFRLDLGAAQI